VPVVELYVTARPEEAVALTALPVAPTTTPVGAAPKLVVWLPLPMVKLRVTREAAFQLALPVWSALTAQVPAVSRVMTPPLVTEQAVELVE